MFLETRISISQKELEKEKLGNAILLVQHKVLPG